VTVPVLFEIRHVHDALLVIGNNRPQAFDHVCKLFVKMAEPVVDPSMLSPDFNDLETEKNEVRGNTTQDMASI
jgi:hypothetical protein